MSISKEEVQKVAILARLKLSDDELERYSNELASILGHIGSLSGLDTAGIEPMTSSITNQTTPTRPDIAHTGDFIETFRQNLHMNSPEPEGNFFRVPKI